MYRALCPYGTSISTRCSLSIFRKNPMERVWRSPRSSIRIVSVQAAELCSRVSVLFSLLSFVSQATCVPCLMQPIRVKIVLLNWAIPNPVVGIPGITAARSGPPAAPFWPWPGPVKVEAGKSEFPPVSSGDAPPFEDVSDFPFAEVDFPFALARMFETILSYEGLFSAVELVPGDLPAVPVAGVEVTPLAMAVDVGLAPEVAA
jgi:hypothetical protein